MSDGTVTWASLWNETAERVPRPQARWLCEVASGYDGDEFLSMLDRPATQRAVAHLDSMLARPGEDCFLRTSTLESLAGRGSRRKGSNANDAKR